MGDNLDKVFVGLFWGNIKDSRLEWALDHFDKDKTQLMIFNHSYWRYNEEYYRNRSKGYWLPRCAEKNFKVEVLIPAYEVGSDYTANLRNAITRHGINKLVTDSDDLTKSACSKAFNEAPYLSCKIWFIAYKDNENRWLDCKRHFGPFSKDLDEYENLNKIVKGEISRREKVEKELLMMKKMVEDETSRRENVEKELLSVANKTKLNEQEIDRLNQEIAHLIHEIDPLEHCNTLSTTFSFQELEQATENFSDSLKIGEGEYSHVYKGTFRGTTVAIKKFKPESMPSLSMLRKEVIILSTVKHPNLVTFLGVCSEPPSLVYEFLSRGSLQKYLNNADNTTPLPWQLRIRIIGEVCAALIFLQLNKPKPIIHGNLMPDKILLDSDFRTKLCDFGLTKHEDTDADYLYPARSLIYMDPEYLFTEEMTLESDVYSFGILILHLLTGRCHVNISKTIEKAIGNDSFSTIIDESAGKWPLQHATELAKIGVRCANALRSKRPNLVNEVKPLIERLVKASDEIMYDPNSLGQPFRNLGISSSDQGRE